MTLVRKSKYITRTIWYTYHFITSVMCSCNSREEEKNYANTIYTYLDKWSIVELLRHQVTEKIRIQKCLPTYLPLVMLSSDGYSANQKKFDIFAAMRMKEFDYYYVEIRNCTMKSPIGTVYLLKHKKKILKLFIFVFNTHVQFMEHCSTLNCFQYLLSSFCFI